jgi:hypothetical protein
MFLIMVLAAMMQVAIMQIVDVPLMKNGRVAAPLSVNVHMHVAGVNSVFHRLPPVEWDDPARRPVK